MYIVDRPDRAFYFDVIFQLDNPYLVTLASGEKPPLHFHPHQEEYIEVLEGQLGVEVEGKEYKLTPSDGELLVRPWQNHRLYPLVDPGSKTTRFLLSGEKTSTAFRLDTVFFQNWYRYQEEVVLTGGKLDLIQVMNVRSYIQPTIPPSAPVHSLSSTVCYCNDINSHT